MYSSPIMMLMGMVLFMSSIMALSSSNWFFIWLSMELNMLSFIPLLLNNTNMMEIESAIKYFITQSIASSCMLMCSLMMWVNNNTMFFNMLLGFAILMKLGSFPCHFWFPSVMLNCSWSMCMLLTTWQKIIPIFILFSIINMNKSMMIIVCLFNMFIGGMFGMNMSNIKSIMAYSSISHMGWMLSMKIMNMITSMYMYFIVYIMMVIPTFMLLKSTNISNLSNVSLLNKHNFMNLLVLSMMVLSMAGLPPFTGFFLKLMVIYNMVNFSSSLMIMLVMLSIMSLYFYLNLTYNMMFNMYMNSFNEFKGMKINGIMPMGSILLLSPLIFMMYAMTLFN